MKNLFFTIIFILFTSVLFAQQNYEDVVYLKNGSIIHGVIIEQVPNVSIKISTGDRNVFVYKIDEIEKFTKEPIQGAQARSNNNTDGGTESGLEKGYQLLLETGFAVGDEVSMVKVDVVNGIRFNPYIALGIGTGLSYYPTDYGDVVYIPLFLDVRTNFINQRVSPYFGLQLGLSDIGTAGLMFKPSVGVSFRVGSSNSMNIGICYNLQDLEMEYYSSSGYPYYSSYYTTQQEAYSAIGINVGISF